MTRGGVALHDVLQDGVLSDRHHGFRDVIGHISDARAIASTEDDRLHAFEPTSECRSLPVPPDLWLAPGDRLSRGPDRLFRSSGTAGKRAKSVPAGGLRARRVLGFLDATAPMRFARESGAPRREDSERAGGGPRVRLRLEAKSPAARRLKVCAKPDFVFSDRAIARRDVRDL